MTASKGISRIWISLALCDEGHHKAWIPYKSPPVRVEVRITLERPDHIVRDPTTIKPAWLWRDALTGDEATIFRQDQHAAGVQGHKILDRREPCCGIRVRPSGSPRDVRSDPQRQVFCAALPFTKARASTRLEHTGQKIGLRQVIRWRMRSLEHTIRPSRVQDAHASHHNLNAFAHSLEPRWSRIIPDRFLTWTGFNGCWSHDRSLGHCTRILGDAACSLKGRGKEKR
jgi:hypothetical protein